MTATARESDFDLVACMRQLSSARSLEEVMAFVSHCVRTVLRADGATFVMRDGDRCYYADEDAVSPLWKGRRFPMSACISGWCMTNRQQVAIADIYKDDRIPADAYRPTFVHSLAMAPVGHDEPVAALGAYWSETRQPEPQELERLQAIADAAALALAFVQRPVAAPGPRSAWPALAHRSRDPQRAPGTGKRKTRAGPSFKAAFERFWSEGLRPSSPGAYAFAVSCVLAATLARLGVEEIGVHGLAVFSTYFPAVLIAILAGGTRAGLLAAVFGGLAAHWMFMPPRYQFAPLTASDFLNFALYFGASGLIVLIVDGYRRTVARLKQEDARHLTLAREERHRIQNAASVMEAIVRQTLRDRPDEARTISRRLRASLAQMDISDRTDNEPIGVKALFTAQLQGFDLSRFTLDGEAATSVPPEVRNVLALAAHELATNALKYGALSTPEGGVSVAWRPAGGRITIRWRETGGPRVQPPKRRGYGSVLLRRLLEASGGAISMEFRPEGLTAEISLPLRPPKRR